MKDVDIEWLRSRDVEPMFWTPERRDRPSAWWAHVPFAFWVTAQCKPRLLVELGTRHGVSYLAFCQAVAQLGLSARCFAVDSWKGDAGASTCDEEDYKELSEFHDKRYAAFSQLLRKTFDDASGDFADGSIDLLHIDGLRSYEQARHDFETWRPKLSQRAVVLFHNTNLSRDDVGVRRFFDELKREAPSFEFLHACGLGVAAVGLETPEAIERLCALTQADEIAAVRQRFSFFGERWTAEARAATENAALANKYATLAKQVRSHAANHESADGRPPESIGETQLGSDVLQQLAGLKRTDYDGALPRKLRRRLRFWRGANKKAKGLALDYRTLAASPLFDAQWYLTNNSDVADAEVDPVLHYLCDGARDGRAPGPYFDGQAYLRANPDVAVAGTNPLLHFIRLGAKERRRLSRVTGDRDAMYREWIERNDTLGDADRRAIAEHLAQLRYQPLISIVMPAFETPPRNFRQAIESVLGQLYRNWELCVADDASPSAYVGEILAEYSARDNRIKWMRRAENGNISAASNSALELATGEFVALMDHDDLLAPQALYEVAAELNDHPQADVIYSDEDHIDDDGRRSNPYFKTDWNPELFLEHNFISHLGAYRRSLLLAVGGFRLGFEGSQDYDLALRCVRATTRDKIRHIPAVLYHWRRTAAQTSFSQSQLERCITAARKAKNEYLEAVGDAGEVVAHPQERDWDRVIRPTPAPAPLVSLIVPTHNRADLLGPCLDGLMNRTSYQPIEIIIVDHRSDDPETLALLRRVGADPRVRIMPYEGPFNFSRMNNRAVELAHGEIVGLVNNDIDVIAPDWLTEMVPLAAMPENGAVGAKLLYRDGRVQHAGVGLGIGGIASHFFRFADPNAPGYFGRLQLTSNVSAVTAACLVVRKSLYAEVGGLNEIDLTVAFNDVDFCLKLRERGYRNVWSPFALLYHRESPSRGADDGIVKVARFRKEIEWMEQTWGDELRNDPYYSPNLSLSDENFDFALISRRRKPWQSAKSE